jgi:CheY-like chemotaxis protein
VKNAPRQIKRHDPQGSHSILIVDNDRDVLMLCRSFFEIARYTVFTVSSAEEALSFLNEHIVDIVLTDVFITGMNGLDLTRKIKESTDSYVIVMTGATDLISFEEAKAAGADFFFPKPVFPAELVASANRLVKKEGVTH